MATSRMRRRTLLAGTAILALLSLGAACSRGGGDELSGSVADSDTAGRRQAGDGADATAASAVTADALRSSISSSRGSGGGAGGSGPQKSLAGADGTGAATGNFQITALPQSVSQPKVVR